MIIIRIVVVAACAVLAAAALARALVLATVDVQTPSGVIDIVVSPHHAAFWQLYGFHFDIGVSIALLVPLVVVVAVVAPKYIRTVPTAIGIGMWAGAGIANGTELVLTGAVIDYLSIRFDAGAGTRYYLITNLPDLVVVASLVLLGVCFVRMDLADRRVRRAALARAGPPE